MDIEHLDIADFLAQVRPFDTLDRPAVEALARQVEIIYARSGTRVLAAGVQNTHLFLVRSGAVELHQDGTLFNTRLGEGSFFAYPSLLRDGITRNQVTAIEDSLLYRIPETAFHAVCKAHPDVELHFAKAETDRLRAALNQPRATVGTSDIRLFSTRLAELIVRDRIVGVDATATVAEAASLMTAENVSTVLVFRAQTLAGILTDKDLRSRVTARSLPATTPVADVMTADPATVTPDTHLFEALLMMTRKRFHHLPITQPDGEVIGLVSASDILNSLSSNAVYLAARIGQARTAQDVTEITRQLPRVVYALSDGGATAEAIGHMASSVGEASHVRLLELAEAELGPPPVPYALVVFGSLAREDQTALSDQDNGFILSDAYDPDAHGAYFSALATRLCDSLNDAGYWYCNGGIMATTDQWRQPLAAWKDTFSRWITTPEPKALMHATIFFDMRGLHGDRTLVDALRTHALDLAKGNRIFLAALVQNALDARVPLGFFRRFVLQSDQQHHDTLDLKKQGVVPVVDIARVHALAHGIAAVNTNERLTALEEAHALQTVEVADLKDALEFVATIRLLHQARRIKAGQPPDNFVAPDDLSSFEREHLRDAFSLIRGYQEGLVRAYAGGRL